MYLLETQSLVAHHFSGEYGMQEDAAERVGLRSLLIAGGTILPRPPVKDGYSPVRLAPYLQPRFRRTDRGGTAYCAS